MIPVGKVHVFYARMEKHNFCPKHLNMIKRKLNNLSIAFFDIISYNINVAFIATLLVIRNNFAEILSNKQIFPEDYHEKIISFNLSAWC